MAIKILHTADWHIGKKLHEYSLSDDHQLFMDWIVQLIKARSIDYLLISGDVFDLANPAQESLKLYYQFLADLEKTGCKAIITAGNHDSPALIDAPAHLLNALNIKVIGSVPENLDALFFELKDHTGKPEACLAAVPFLRDRDIRKAGEGESYDDRVQAVREGIAGFYSHVANRMKEIYPTLPHLAAGHLYVQGTTLSDSEREIQVGNLAGVDSSAFPESLEYVALGHIHKAQNVGKGQKVRYSGSPIPLSFSEKDYQHKVILLEIENSRLKQEDIYVDVNRKLAAFSGTFQEIKQEVEEMENEYTLPVLIDINIVEEVYDPNMIEKIEEFSKMLKAEGKKEIIHTRIKYKNSSVNLDSPEHTNIREELTPEKIFSELISKREEAEQKKLMQLFLEIKQEAEESEV